MTALWKNIELYDHFPFNYKTFIHNQAVVKPGERVQPGQLLAKSNYTDRTTATWPWARTCAWGTCRTRPSAGNNYEDAIVLSETAARQADQRAHEAADLRAR
jgi:DNA-directed RNA polymerase beta subunit